LENSFSVIPNPNNGNMTIEYSIPPENNAEFAIYDMTGRKISSYMLSGINNLITISANLNNGVYVCNLIINGKTTAQGRIVIIN